MAQIIELTTLSDTRGSLTVIEKIIPFEIKRVFYIYDVDNSVRGKHRHKKTRQALVCISGSCRVYNNNGKKVEEDYLLDKPNKCLILEPEDWHYMYEFTKDCVLLVFASEFFDPEDYIFKNIYEKTLILPVKTKLFLQSTDDFLFLYYVVIKGYY